MEERNHLIDCVEEKSKWVLLISLIYIIFASHFSG